MAQVGPGIGVELVLVVGIAQPGEDGTGDLLVPVVFQEGIQFLSQFLPLLKVVMGEGKVQGGGASQGACVGRARLLEGGNAIRELVLPVEGPAAPELGGGLLGGLAPGKVGEEPGMTVSEFTQVFEADLLVPSGIDDLLVEDGLLCPGVLLQGGLAGMPDEPVEFEVSLGGILEFQENFGPLHDRVVHLRVV